MSKKILTNKVRTREENSHPYLKISLRKRLIASGAIDLRDNHTISQKGSYIVISPKDKSKKIRQK